MDAITGLPCSVLTTRIGRVSPFHRWYCCQRAPTKQRDTDHIPFWAGPNSRFGPTSLTVFISDSLTLTLRSSLAPHRMRLPNPAKPLAGSSEPARVATLSARSAPSRYQLRTAPRLRVVGHPVGSRPRPRQTIANTAYAVVVPWVPLGDPGLGCSSRSRAASRPATDATSGRTLGKLLFYH